MTLPMSEHQEIVRSRTLAEDDDAAQLRHDGLDLVFRRAGVELQRGRVDLGHAAASEDSRGNDEQSTGEKFHVVVLVPSTYRARHAS